MATSRIRLYKIPDLKEENNYIVEELAETFLIPNYWGIKEISGFQFQRLESQKTIKVNLTQLTDTPIPVASYNYCAIWVENYGGIINTARGVAFYFIEQVEQVAVDTIKFYLKLDVLNTFYDRFKTCFTNGTYIARGHEDRFAAALMYDLDPKIYLVHKFNRINEGDNLQLIQNLSDKKTIYEEAKGDTAANPLKFYLIYRSSENGRPCIDLCANRQIAIGAGSTGPTYSLKPSQMAQGRYYYLMGNISFSIDGSRNTWVDIPGYTGWSGFADFTKTVSGDGFLIFWKGTKNGHDYIFFKFVSSTDDINAEQGEYFILADPPDLTNGDEWNRTIKTDNSEGQINILLGQTLYYSNTQTYNQDLIKTFQKIEIGAGTYSPKMLGDISLLDKTDEAIVKVVECPYCPVPYTYDAQTQVYTISSQYFPNESEEEAPPFLRTYDVGKELPKRLVGALLDFKNYLYQSGQITAIEGLLTNPAALSFLIDPKIYTSQYFVITLVYDSFSKQVKYEDWEYVGQNLVPGDALDFYYKQSANVSSALMFEYESSLEYDGYGFELKKSEENYPRVLVASRNNELALFSSAYLNYLRNGYNYEKKKQAEQMGFQGSMAALQTIGSILSFALSGVTGGASAIAGAGLAVGAATTFANMGYSAYRGSEDLSNKIAQLKAQSYTVSGIDDLDLFNEYGKNKLQVLIYKVKDNDFAMLRAKFQYFGYAVDKYANPWPFYFNGRHNFNYIKCDPIFRLSGIEPIPEEYMEEIAERFRAGVTIWHKRYYTQLPNYQYELNRDYENMEESIMELFND